MDDKDKKRKCGMVLYRQERDGVISVINFLKQKIIQRIKVGYIEVTCQRCWDKYRIDSTANWLKFDPIPDGIGILDGGEICHWDLKELELN